MLVTLACIEVIFATLILGRSSHHDWWQKTILYEVYPLSFYDTDGDGIGDLKGIASKADYLKELGVGGIWICPFFTTQFEAFAYDIVNYTEVDPVFGTYDDFVHMLSELKARGIRVIMDFVPNHTSDKHPWFEKSRNRVEPYTDYYVWADGKPTRNDTPNNWIGLFTPSAWQWCPIRKQFYLHQGGISMPDLNYRSSHVREEMKSVLRFWLDRGISGIRIDAIKHLVEDKLLRDEPRSNYPNVPPGNYYYLIHNMTTNQPENLEMLSEWRDVLTEYEKKDGLHRLLIVEVIDTFENVKPYFGTEDHPLADMPFNFELTWTYHDVTAEQVKSVLEKWLNDLPTGKWPNWIVGSHDVSRIASHTDPELVDAFNMIILMMKGTPVTYYGEELGMVDITADELKNVTQTPAGPNKFIPASYDPMRTPMQWNTKEFAGFTTGSKPWMPVKSGYEKVNVKTERSDSRSHLHTYKRLSKLRGEPALSDGQVYFPNATTSVLTFVRAVEGHPAYLVAVNFGKGDEQLDLSQHEVDDFKFPKKATVEVNSDNIPDDSPLGRVGDDVALTNILLGPKQAVVLKFKPQWT